MVWVGLPQFGIALGQAATAILPIVRRCSFPIFYGRIQVFFQPFVITGVLIVVPPGLFDGRPLTLASDGKALIFPALDLSPGVRVVDFVANPPTLGDDARWNANSCLLFFC